MVVVYCRSGRRSMAVTTLLRDRGFVDVKSMAGGILRWSREIDPSIPQY
jgi:adenylyltransferase/sulfurtransferase